MQHGFLLAPRHLVVLCGGGSIARGDEVVNNILTITALDAAERELRCLRRNEIDRLFMLFVCCSSIQ